MNDYQNQSQYIPESRQQIIDLCLSENRLSAADSARFRVFCDLLAAYSHFEFHQIEETLKRNYLPFNPDINRAAQREHKTWHNQNSESQIEQQLIELLSETLQRANYQSLDWVSIQQAIKLVDLVEIKTEIDFHDYEQLLLFHRGKSQRKGSRSKLLWTKHFDMMVYSNVMLGLKFRDEAYFTKKGQKVEQLTFRPGSIYLYLYKDIPQNDLELLFPNVQLSMNWFDQVLFVVPAFGAGISMLIKIVPNLLLLLGVITFLLFGPSSAERLGVTESQIHELSPVLFAFTSVMLALGGFAYKQYDTYKNKRIRFMKNVTETLFFRNLANNSSVFHSVIDAAEEEECKEIILAYYHLLINGRCMMSNQLKSEIDKWLQKQFNTKVNFDINKIISRLRNISAEIVPPGAIQRRNIALLTVTDNGECRVPSILEAKMVIDARWDAAYNASD